LWLEATGLRAVEFTGQEIPMAKEEIVLLMGGHLLHFRSRTERTMEWVQKTVGNEGGIRNVIEPVMEHKFRNLPEFRIEVFCAREPYRVQWILAEDSVLRVNDTPLKLRDRDRLRVLLATLGTLVPSKQTGLGLQRAIAGEILKYPSVRAFEEESRWRLYQFLRQQPTG
jgi:hypothetical protein